VIEVDRQAREIAGRIVEDRTSRGGT
jgi:hypothetical protein